MWVSVVKNDLIFIRERKLAVWEEKMESFVTLPIGELWIK